jgi:uncharacterized protein
MGLSRFQEATPMAVSRNYRHFLASSTNLRRRPYAVLAFCIGLLSVTLLTLHPAEDSKPVLTTITTPMGVRVTLVVAQTPTTRSRGLSDQDEMPQDGLLLHWPESGKHPIWMLGMRFPLDLIWCDGDGRILAIERNVPACLRTSECPLYGLRIANSRVVLELAADQAASLGVEVGNVLDIPILRLSQ